MLSVRNKTLATAIPVGTALEAFTSHEDALLAIFVMGLTMGSESPLLANEIADYGEVILRGSPESITEWENFLGTTAMMTEILVCD